MSILIWILIATLLLSLSGCSSVMGGWAGFKGPYKGTRCDLAMITAPTELGLLPLKALIIIDLPFSLIADTVWLPFDLQHELEPIKGTFGF